jgi:ATP-dependent RNA helicase DDX1
MDLPYFQAAETGSGKTGAFVLPAVQLVHEIKRAAEAARPIGSRAAAAAAPTGPSPTLSVTDRSAIVTILPDRLMAQARHEKDWGGVRAELGVSAGRVY